MNSVYPWIIRTALYALLLEIVYIAVANFMLSTDALRNLLNRRPERQQYQWSSAWTIIPGVIDVRDFHLQSRTNYTHWTLSIDKGRFRTSLSSLIRRSFRASWVDGYGVEFTVARPDESTMPPGHTQLESKGSSNSSSSETPPKTSNTEQRPQWKIVLNRVSIRNLKKFDMLGYIWRGEGEVEGNLDMVTRGILHIPEAHAILKDGTIKFQDETVADHLDIDMNMELGPYLPRQNRGRKLFDHLAGTFKTKGNVTQLGFLQYYFKNSDWLTIEGDGKLNADLRFHHGLLLENSSFTYESGQLFTDMKGWRFGGSGTIFGEVTRQNQELDSRLRLSLKSVTVSHHERTPEPLQAPGLDVLVSGKNIRVTDDQPDVDVSLELVDSSIEDLSIYNRLFPRNIGFEILPNSQALLQARVNISNNSGVGTLSLTGSDTGVRLRDQSFRGNFQFSALLKTTDPEVRALQMSDMRLLMADVRNTTDSHPQSAAWNAEILVLESELLLNHPISLASKISFNLSHWSPLVSIFMPGQHQWFDDFIQLQNFRGEGDLRIDDTVMQISSANVEGQGIIAPRFGVEPFRINASCSEIDLKKGVNDARLKFTIPPSTIPDLAIINEYLPAESGILLSPGHKGGIEAGVDIADGVGYAHVTLTGRHTEFKLMDQRFQGNLALRIRLNTRDVMTGTFDLEGTSIEIDSVRCLDQPCQQDWWSNLEIPTGQVTVSKPLILNSELILHMRDSGPILAMFQEDSRSIRWLGDILLIKDLLGTATLRSDSRGMEINDLRLQGNRLDLKAKLRLSPGLKKGILYVKFSGLSMGMELKNGRKSYRLIHPSRWFDRYPWNEE